MSYTLSTRLENQNKNGTVFLAHGVETSQLLKLISIRFLPFVFCLQLMVPMHSTIFWSYNRKTLNFPYHISTNKRNI